MKFSFEQRRRTPWDRKLVLWPLLAASLALLSWSAPPPAPRARPILKVERVLGAKPDGSEFICQRAPGRHAVREFCIWIVR